MSDEVAIFEGLIDAILDPANRQRTRRRPPPSSERGERAERGARAERGDQPRSDTIHAPASSGGGARRKRRRRRGGQQDAGRDSQAGPASE